MKVTQKRILHVKPEEECCIKSLKYYFKKFFHLKISQLPQVFRLLGITTPIEIVSFNLDKDFIKLEFKDRNFVKFYKKREVDPYPHVEFKKEGFIITQKNNIAKNVYSVCDME